jgi:transcriptional pleiotropic regulator of transition state genes
MSYSTSRRVDALGRIVLPAELRRTMAIAEGDQLDIREDNGAIVLAKHEPACVFCGNDTALVSHHDRHVCRDCLTALNDGAGLM